jgi:hypothetical protein
LETKQNAGRCAIPNQYCPESEGSPTSHPPCVDERDTFIRSANECPLGINGYAKIAFCPSCREVVHLHARVICDSISLRADSKTENELVPYLSPASTHEKRQWYGLCLRASHTHIRTLHVLHVPELA